MLYCVLGFICGLLIILIFTLFKILDTIENINSKLINNQKENDLNLKKIEYWLKEYYERKY